MSRQIIKQPDGKYSVWSTIVDDFIVVNATQGEYIQFRIEEETDRIKEDLKKAFQHIDEGHPEKVYYQFAMSYEEACDWRDQVHHKGKYKGVKDA